MAATAVQEALARVGRRPARVVAHADGEHGVLGGGHRHPRARGHLQDDQPEPGGHRVREPRERWILAVPSQQLGVLLVARGLQLGLQPKGDEPRGIGGVGGRDGRVRRYGNGLRLTPLDVLGHGWDSLI
jgi:hypothetical protein